eukprot:6071629-Pleurochrysis_carterae.AAC.1
MGGYASGGAAGMGMAAPMGPTTGPTMAPPPGCMGYGGGYYGGMGFGGGAGYGGAGYGACGYGDGVAMPLMAPPPTAMPMEQARARGVGS